MKHLIRASHIMPGHCVIIDHSDAPSSDNVAVVTQVSKGETGIVFALYLKTGRKAKGALPKCTPINRFGIEIHVSERCYQCVKAEESTATYPDGKIRKWQENRGFHPREIHKEAGRYLLFNGFIGEEE